MNHNVNFDSNSIENEIRGYVGNGQSSRETARAAISIRLSCELNQRITQEMNDLRCSVSSQIQRAKNEGISEHVIPPIQATFRSGPRRVSDRSGKSQLEDWNVDLKKF